MKVTDTDKHSGLLQYGINYERKKSCSTGTGLWINYSLVQPQKSNHLVLCSQIVAKALEGQDMNSDCRRCRKSHRSSSDNGMFHPEKESSNLTMDM